MSPGFDRRSLLTVGGGVVAATAASAAAALSGPAAWATGPTEPASSGAAGAPDAGAPAAVETDDTTAATLDDAVAATATGGHLTVTRAWTRATSLVLDRPMTVSFSGDGSLRMTADVEAIVIRASSVSVQRAVITGTGAGRAAGRAIGIRVAGAAGGELDDIVIEGCRLSDLAHTGVRAEFCDTLTIAGNTIERVAYAGVLLLSVSDVWVRGNTVSDVLQPAGQVNSYGIIVTRDDTVGLDVAPRSTRVWIDGNAVSGVRSWEGIDTHAGDAVLIRDNVVTDCRVGIALVPCRGVGAGAGYSHAPVGFVVTGNTVTRAALTGPGSGIVVKGAGDSVGSDAERATGVVTDNTVTGHGGGTEAGILVYLTRDLIVSGNRLDASVDRAIQAYHSNDRLMLTRNVVTGLVSSTGSGACTVVDVRSAQNKVTITATRFVRPSGSTSSVRGVTAGVAGNALDLLGNDWAATNLPVWGKASTVNRYGDGA
ncbi:right-handed parallel beta-helix repeat-containing protein [Frigoribacterium sp. 2-23]|uniref:right-handed parallel beta-helix repeat-containing protein n=1 Tax=Frigoribacterium sp. 2-23 TaxID=3415006 RepID=UPI003C6F6576